MIHVIKIGGGVIDDAEMQEHVLRACASLQAPFILVHGGGRVATEIAHALNIPQAMVGGRRITDADTLRIVTMTYAGLINKDIIARLQALSLDALGVCGADMNLITAKRREHPEVDFGFVGDIVNVNAQRLLEILHQGVSLVVAPITHDGKGQLLNTNADTVASEIAKALAASGAEPVELVYLFDLPGVLRDIDDLSSVIPEVKVDQVDELVAGGILHAGMLPKITMAVDAARAGIKVRIQHAEELGTQKGTVIQ